MYFGLMTVMTWFFFFFVSMVLSWLYFLVGLFFVTLYNPLLQIDQERRDNVKQKKKRGNNRIKNKGIMREK